MTRNVLAGLLFAVAWCSAGAADKQSAARLQYSTEQFDIASVTLPPRFEGNSAPALYQALAKPTSLKKGEFETSAQFESRRVEAWSKPYLGRISIQDAISVSVAPPGEESNVKLTFDADRSLMNLQLSKAYTPRGCSFLLASNSKRTGSYVGSNAFGVKANVNKYDVTSFCIGGLGDTNISFPIPREKAAKVKSNLRALLIGTVAPPYTSVSEDYSAAKIDNPAEVIFRAYILHLNVEQIWVYDWTSGEVLYRPGMYQANVDLSDSTPGPTQSMDQNGNNLIHQAIWSDRYASAEGHIKRNDADVNGQNKFGATPLHMAVWKKQAKLVSLLLASGADKAIKDKDGKTPLEDAMDKGYSEIAGLLR